MAVIAMVVSKGVAVAAPASPLAADVNRDGCVNDLDLAELDSWNGEPAVAGHPITGRLDVNGDGTINSSDYDLALDEYGQCR